MSAGLSHAIRPGLEWLEADGLGGYAMGTAVPGLRTRRYHAPLVCATSPPTGRMVLFAGFDAFVETRAGTFPLTAQRYAPGVTAPDGARFVASFSALPWPTWRYLLDDGTRLVHELFVPRGQPLVVLAFRLDGGGEDARLILRPFVSGRADHHSHHENPVFDFRVATEGERHLVRPYPGVPALALHANAPFRDEPLWYRQFLYEEERARGLDHVEDLASPGTFAFDLHAGEALLLARAETGSEEMLSSPLSRLVAELRERERARRVALPAGLPRAGDAYLVDRGRGRTVIAGYPWFTDWGRDTFLSMRGLCLATARLDEARAILVEWAGAVSEGMLPNRFPDRGEPPEYNAVDASLWYVIAVFEYLRARGHTVAASDEARLAGAVRAILDGYARGTRHGIRLDGDGLIAAGEAGLALTWMDARFEGMPVTPRIGKPVEVQALWLNALHLARHLDRDYPRLFKRGLASFRERFWNRERGCLFDVVDDAHRPGAVDDALRPNQVLAVGGLPIPMLDRERCRRVLDLLEARLLTPLGLRTLDPDDRDYRPHYRGDLRERDAAYHQGTVWPWLLGPFVEAWVRVRSPSPPVLAEARARFLEPLLARAGEYGLGHLPEIADGDAPHAPNGCPFQAWSVAEALRLDRVVLRAA